MRKNVKRGLLLTSLAPIFACARLGMKTLVPKNEIARQFALPTLQHEEFGARSGPVEVVMPNGEVLHGRFLPCQNFDIVEALRSGGVATALGVGEHSSIVINAVGYKTTLKCRGSEMRGHGEGECRLSNGAAYQLYFYR